MTISYSQLEEVAYELNRRAAIAVPLDAKNAFVDAAERETNPDAKRALLAVIDNAGTAVAQQSSMCGDTGLPRFYVKAGNDVRLEGGFAALERRGPRGDSPGHQGRPAALQPRASADAAQPGHQRRRDGAERRLSLRARGRLDRPHGRAQGRPVRQRLPHALPRRRHPRHQAVLRRHAGLVRPSRPVLPAGDRRRRHRRHQRPVRHARQGSVMPATRGRPAPRSARREARTRAARIGQPHDDRHHGLQERHAGARRALRDRLHAHRRPAHRHQRTVPRRAARDGPHLQRRPRRVPRRPAVVHRILPARGSRLRARRTAAVDQGRRRDEGPCGTGVRGQRSEVRGQ